MLSSSLCPRTDILVHVMDHVNARAARLDIPRIEDSETKVRVRRNITLANKKVLKKGEHPTVKCQVQVPRMGYLKGDVIPLKIDVWHAAPIKHLQGASISLMRTAKFRAKG